MVCKRHSVLQCSVSGRERPASEGGETVPGTRESNDFHLRGSKHAGDSLSRVRDER